MRLINAQTGLFEEFLGRNIPQYAMLSHTWEEEEVSFKDMSGPSCRAKKGYQKIAMTCRMAAEAGLSYAWVDTCCIDKSSSAELTEAINSMYRWYQRSNVCYAYLSDLGASSSLGAALQNCRWFTRGWTLQELIAPQNVIFFDQDWNMRGSKRHLIEELSRITGIDGGVLEQSRPLLSMSVAQKMSWAAHRVTTRIEDTAYCLLGIFNVNMPLLYGEEEKAFRRLQEEIVKSTPDLSIFAWRLPAPPDDSETRKSRVFCGFLAESPLAFGQSGSFARQPHGSRREFSVSNCGIKTQIRTLGQQVEGTCAVRYILPLDCSWDPNLSLGVRLKKCGPDEYVREDPWTVVEYTGYLSANAPFQRYLLTDLSDMTPYPDTQTIDSSVFTAQTRSHVLQLQNAPGIQVFEAWSRARWDDEDRVFFIPKDSAQDSSALRLGVRLEFPDHGNEVKFNVMFFAVGWSALENGSPQCTVVDYEQNSMLDDAFSRITTWDHDTYQVLDRLIDSGIPKTPSAIFNIPGTEFYVVVSFTLDLVSDAAICQNVFWRVYISHQICNSENLPRICYEQWTRR